MKKIPILNLFLASLLTLVLFQIVGANAFYFSGALILATFILPSEWKELIGNLEFNAIVCSLFSFIGFILFGESGLYLGLGLFAVSLLPFSHFAPKGALQAGLLKEIWISIFMQNFYRKGDFISRSVDMTAFVDNNTIHLAEAGVDPTVLVNNTTYPIPTSAFDADPLALSLNYYDTENTVVYNALQKQYSFDAVAQTVYRHQMALRQSLSDFAAWSYSPQENSAVTPVFATSGSARTDKFGRSTLAFQISDLAKMQLQFDRAVLPGEGRIAVLSPTHRADILNEDVNLFKRFAELGVGEVLPLYGWEIMMYQNTGIYANSGGSAGQLAAYGASPASTDAESSLFYCDSEVMRADGELEMFFRPKAQNPDYRGDQIGFQKRFIALSIRNKAQGAVYDMHS